MVLDLLLEADGGVVSGQFLSEKLGLDPSEVYRRLNGLRCRGYGIQRLRGGYRLEQMPDAVGHLEVGAFLTAAEIGRVIHHREKVPSTNEIAFRLARGGAFHGELVVAEQQVRGRGRCGRNWFSPAGLNLYFSVILRPDLETARAPELTFVVAVALARALGESLEGPVGIKWPNDVQIQGKKVAGILPELHAKGNLVDFVVAGVGVNVNMSESDLPVALAGKATSLRIEKGRTFGRPRLLAGILDAFEDTYNQWIDEGFGPIRDAWLSLDVTLGRKVRVGDEGGENLVGEAVSVDESGALVIRCPDGGLVKVVSGDVATFLGA